MIGFSAIPSTMTPEFSNILLGIDAFVLLVFLFVVSTPRIAAGSTRVARLFGLPALLERFKHWLAAHKRH